MKNPLLLKNFHPNEQVAAAMAEKVAQQLRTQGTGDVLVVDLEVVRLSMRGLSGGSWADVMNRDWWSKYRVRDTARKSRSNYVAFDFHDSDIADIEETNRKHGSALRLPDFLRDNDCWVVECPAVYVPQEDIAIARLGTTHSLRDAKYFTHRSDVRRSQARGFLSSKIIAEITNGIVQRLR